jgi:hypothetical protein
MHFLVEFPSCVVQYIAIHFLLGSIIDATDIIQQGQPYLHLKPCSSKGPSLQAGSQVQLSQSTEVCVSFKKLFIVAGLSPPRAVLHIAQILIWVRFLEQQHRL